MGNSDCCEENNLDIIEYESQIKDKSPEQIIEIYMGIIERMNKKIIFEKDQTINKSYLTNLSNIPELIENIKKNIELIKNNQEKVKNEEIEKNLKEKIDIIISEIDQKIISISNEIKLLSELVLKQNDEANHYLKLCDPFKNEAIKYINEINEIELEKYINKKNPTKKEFMILRLIFLIINPEAKAKIPGLIIIKDLEIMKQECFNKGPDIIKQKLIERLDYLSVITPDFFEDNKLFTEFPYNDLLEMEKISNFHKNFFGFFQNFIKCKKSYDIYEPFLKKYEETKKNKKSLLKKKDRLETIKQQIIMLN